MSAPSVTRRLAYMALGWGSVGVVYSLSALTPVDQAHLLHPGAIDRWFEFDPRGIWLYMSFFLLVPLGYLCASPQRLGWLLRMMLLCAAGAGLVFAVFPTTMTFPPVTQSGISAEMLRALIRVDTLVNCLPSLHVALSLAVLAALWQRANPWRNLLLSAWVAAIMVSILQLHRHQFVDMLAGAALVALAALILARWPLPAPAKPEVSR